MKSIKILNKKDGMALLTVMLIFLVLSILLAGVVASTTSNMRQSVVTKNHTAAFYASEAGLTKVTTDFENQLKSLVNQTPSLSTSAFLTAVSSYITTNSTETIYLNNNNGEISYAEVTIQPMTADAGYQVITIISNGFVGEIERSLVKTYRFKFTEGSAGLGFSFDKAVISKNNISLATTASITGAPIASYSSANGAISFTSSGGLLVDAIEIVDRNMRNTIISFGGTNNYSNVITGGENSVTTIKNIQTFPNIMFPSYSTPSDRLPVPSPVLSNMTIGNSGLVMNGFTTNLTYTIPSNNLIYYVPTLRVRNNSNFKINVGDNNFTFIVDNLLIQGPMQIIGNGSLTVIVRSNSTNISNISNKLILNNTGGITGDCNINVNPITTQSKLRIYIDRINMSNGTNPTISLTTGGSSYLCFPVFSMNVNFTVNSGGRYFGHIITGGNISFTGGSTSNGFLYYAPFGNVSLTNGSRVKGAVVANNFTISGNSHLVFQDIDIENFPLIVDNIFPEGTGGGGLPSIELLEGSTIEQ